MNKKLLCMFATFAWTASYQAATSQELINESTNIKQYLQKTTSKHFYKNIFKDSSLHNRIDAQRSSIDTWLDGQLKKYNSNTLSLIYDHIKYRAESIVKQLKDFSTHLDEMNKPEVLQEFKEQTSIFRHDRDQLQEELKPGGSLRNFETENKKALLRRQARKDAKQEIANVLKAYAETFAQVAQKAITDFAYIDAEMFTQEKARNAKPVAKAEDMPRAATMESTIQPLEDEIEEESYMLTPALKNMPKPTSNLMKEETDFTKALKMYSPSGE